MRGSTALLLAGAVTIVVGTTAPVLAAEDPARVAPATGAVETSEALPEETTVESADGEETATEETEGGLARPSLETAEAADRDSGATNRRDAKERRAGSPKQPLADNSVTIKDFEYQPDPVTISPGDSVTWTNRDMAQHSATDDGEFDTGLLKKGESGTVTIDQAGTYDYICTVHPDMRAKLIAGDGESSSGSGTSSGSSGGTSSSSGGSSFGGSTGGSTGTVSPSSSSGGTLPNTGQEQLPLLILGAGLIAAGLLARAFHEFWIWR